MPLGDSAQSGTPIPGLMPLAGCDEGYDMGSGSMDMAYKFVFEHLGLSRDFFDCGGLDCHYGNNYGHGEMRGDAPFMRPTNASKLILKRAVESGAFDDPRLAYGYHGTRPENLKPILETELKPSSSGAAGPGVYFSPFPLYAQLYSSSSYHGLPVYTWQHAGKTYFVDTMLMIRVPPLSEYSGAIDEIAATIGAEYCIHKLFATARMDLEKMVIARLKPSFCSRITIQGVVVKFHEKNPYEDGGEWDLLNKLAERA